MDKLHLKTIDQKISPWFLKPIPIPLFLYLYCPWRGILDREEAIDYKPFTTISDIISGKQNRVISTGDGILTELSLQQPWL